MRANRGLGPRPLDARAFTLVELLIVVTIVLLLLAILAPSFRGVQQRAAAARCMSNLHQIGVAFAKRRADASTGMGSGSSSQKYYPVGDAWPGIPYDSVKNAPAIFACPSLGESVDEGDRPSLSTIFKNTIYYCRNRGYYIRFDDPNVQRMGAQHVGMQFGTGPKGKYLEFCVEDVDPPVTSILAQGDDGAVHVDLDTSTVTAQLIDGGCGEHNCILYFGKPMFPQWQGKPADPAEWYDPASVGTNGYYGYTGAGKVKVGQVVFLNGMRCDYGINKDAYKMGAGETQAAVIDFEETVVNYDVSDMNVKLTKVADARHNGNINVLRAGGDVVTKTPAQLNPAMPDVTTTWWKP